MLSLNSILVYTDLSDASAEALRTAHAMARAAHASLEVVRVVAEPLAADWTSELSTAGLPAVQDAMETEVQEWLELVLGDVETVGVDLDVETGDPAGEVARHAATNRPDLVVVGVPRAEQGEAMDMARRLVGSLSCSVLVVRSAV